MKEIALVLFLISFPIFNALAKEIALTFDDAPVSSTVHFESLERTKELVRKMKVLNVPSIMVFANPCKESNREFLLKQLSYYKDNGHFIGNHTCSHPRFDDVGFQEFSQNAGQADKLLLSLFSGQKFFRFPYLNEGKEEEARNKMRSWLSLNGYRNAPISIDNDDTIVTERINKAKVLGKKIDYDKVKALFLKHIISAAEFYENMAIKNLGYSPKHVLLLHEIDGTVMFFDSLVKELRKLGWRIIDVKEAYEDPLYKNKPKNTYARNGIIAQSVFEKTGRMPEITYYKWDELTKDLNQVLDLEESINK